MNIKSMVKGALGATAESSPPQANPVPATTASPQPKANVPAPQRSALPATVSFDDMESLPTGLENVTARDVVIPRLVVLQGLSPQLDKNKPEYIKGASSGDFCDVATGEVWKEGIHIIPVYFATVYLEWAPRETGKGLVANHGTDASILEKCTRDENGKFVTADGNYIAETATYFVLNLSAGGRRSFIPLSSTQLKHSRKWMTFITNEKQPRKDGKGDYTPPIYFRSWEATTVGETNNKGSWNGWKFTPSKTVRELDPTAALLQEAVEFNAQAKAGMVRGDFGPQDEAEPDNSRM